MTEISAFPLNTSVGTTTSILTCNGSGTGGSLLSSGLVLKEALAESATGTSASGTNTVLLDVGGIPTLVPVSALPSGASGIEVIQGTTTISGLTTLTVSGGGTLSGASPSGTLAISGGSGGSGITVTDGTHTVSGATTLSVTGATVGGTSPDATLAISGSGATFTRPALSAFSSFGTTTGLTTSEPFGSAGPILLDMVNSLSLSCQLTGIQQSVSGSEYLVTAKMSFDYALDATHVSAGVGLINSTGQIFSINQQGQGNLIELDLWFSSTIFDDRLNAINSGSGDTSCWFRIYYQASNTAAPYTLYRSWDGIAWGIMYYWNGTTGGLTSPFIATEACFYVNPNDVSALHMQSTLYHWSIALGTGSSLNPFAFSPDALS